MKKNMVLPIFIIFLLIGSILTGGLFIIQQGQEDKNPERPEYKPDDTNQTGEDFEFYDLNGNIKKLSDYHGKIVILDIWATWCEPCQYQMLELLKILDYYHTDDLVILSINIDSRDSADDITDFIDAYASYGYYLDWEFGRQKDNLEKYMNNGGIPTVVLFDRVGSIHYKKTGLCAFNEVPEGWPSTTPLLGPKIDEKI